MIWHGQRGFGPAPLARWRHLSKAWQGDAVAPLRNLRRALKGRDGWEEIRASVKRLELAAEKAELDSFAASARVRSPNSGREDDTIAPLSALLGEAFATRQTRKILAEVRKMRGASRRSASA